MAEAARFQRMLYLHEVQPSTGPVRQGEEIDVSSLAAYLRGRLEGADTGIQVEQFLHGHSNLVYLLRLSGSEYVLRRPPLGPVAPKAHDMAREYRVLQAVHPCFSEAPSVHLLCEDTGVIGSAFFLMERRHGIVIRDAVPAELATIPEYERRVSEAFIDCLVRLHAVNVSHGPLRALGKPQGFVLRQVRGWAERWTLSRTEHLPEMDRVVRWLEERLPGSVDATLVHNDFKLDNVMMHPTGDRVAAVLDWEMTTIGDPLADLGLTLCYWVWAGADEEDSSALPAITTQAGWYTRDQFLERYARRSGRDVSQVGYHEVLGIFKLAVILQQIYYRFRQGQTRDERFRHFDARVRRMVRLAAGLIERKHA